MSFCQRCGKQQNGEWIRCPFCSSSEDVGASKPLHYNVAKIGSFLVGVPLMIFGVISLLDPTDEPITWMIFIPFGLAITFNALLK